MKMQSKEERLAAAQEKNYTLEFGVETGEQVSEEFQAENDAEALKLATARIAGGEGLITGIALYGDNVSWEYSYGELEWSLT